MKVLSLSLRVAVVLMTFFSAAVFAGGNEPVSGVWQRIKAGFAAEATKSRSGGLWQRFVVRCIDASIPDGFESPGLGGEELMSRVSAENGGQSLQLPIPWSSISMPKLSSRAFCRGVADVNGEKNKARVAGARFKFISVNGFASEMAPVDGGECMWCNPESGEPLVDCVDTLPESGGFSVELLKAAEPSATEIRSGKGFSSQVQLHSKGATSPSCICSSSYAGDLSEL